MVETKYVFSLEIIDYVQRAQHGTFRRFRSLVDDAGLGVEDPALGIIATPPFFPDDSSLRVQLVILAKNVVRPVVQDHQHGIHERIPYERHLVYVVAGLFARSERIHVRPESHAIFPEKFQQGCLRIVFQAVEGHVLKKMSQAVLIVVFLQGAHIVDYIEIGYSFFVDVLPDVVGEAVRQLSCPQLWV